MRTQLKRATEKYGYMISKMPSYELSQPLAQEINQVPGRSVSGLQKQNSCPEYLSELGIIPRSNGGISCSTNGAGSRLERARSIPASSEVSLSNITAPESQEISARKNLTEVKKSEAIAIPEDFLCPISLELMRDPVIVATGQVSSFQMLHKTTQGAFLFSCNFFSPSIFHASFLL